MTTDFLSIKKRLPTLGVGLGLRRELADKTFQHTAEIDWLEFVPENYMQLGGMARARLDAARELFPLVSHGINLSIGSADDLNADYLKALKHTLDLVGSPWFSDHLCFTSIEGRYLHDLLPLPFTFEAVRHVAQRIKRVQEFVERPFLIENISYYMQMPGAQMSEAQFLAEVVEQADCGILLDVNNVYVNSCNHGFDPLAYLTQIPLERTVQLHVAGHKKIGQYTIDTHGCALIAPVYQLLEEVLKRTCVHAVLLERDQNFPAFDELLGELSAIRSIAGRCRPGLVLPQRAQPHSAAAGSKFEKPAKGGRDWRALSA